MHVLLQFNKPLEPKLKDITLTIDKYPTERILKKRIKELKAEYQVKTHEAYELLSQEISELSWRELKPKLEDYWLNTPPQIDPLQQKTERSLVDLNINFLTKMGIEFSFFEPTPTGFKKSILDATAQVRTHFELESFHFYYAQSQGPEHKVIKTSELITSERVIPAKVSLYRPKTKKGDPRMWFRKLADIASPSDTVAIIILKDVAYLINLSQNNLEHEFSNTESYISIFLNTYIEHNTSVSTELLLKLKELAKEPFKALRKGDTAIGYTLETLLGIEANSSKLPDYKGIELKAGRSKTRTNLFAQVADWSISPCKKSSEILDKYGYERGEDFKLYCTVSTQKNNSQGLSFKYDAINDQLVELFQSNEVVAIWPGNLLRSRLIEKHAETFWIQADSFEKDGVEHFQLRSVIHTKRPMVNQLMILLKDGVVTMDHLIKRNGKNNRVSEKGPLFKIDKKNLSLLFPEPVKYTLD